jgi:hypothetical protein
MAPPYLLWRSLGLQKVVLLDGPKKRFEQLLDEVGRSPPRQVRPKMKCRPADRIKPRAVARAALQYRRNQPKNHDHDSLQS